MKHLHTVLLALVVSGLSLVDAAAAVPLTSPEEDRRAKQAIPPAGKALVYVFRAQDSGPALSPPVRRNGRMAGPLAVRTYFYWQVDPGKVEVRAGDADSARVTLRGQTGRIYFVRLTVTRDGQAQLQQVTYGAGRNGMHNARLAREGRESRPRVSDTAVAPLGGFTLGVKAGSFQLGKSSQTILGQGRNFSSGALAYGLDGEWVTNGGFAFGGEIFSHRHDFTTLGAVADGDMQATLLLINAKKYFRPESTLHPFIGAGIGLVNTQLGGSLTGSASGFAVQASGGLALRWKHANLQLELKYLNARTEGSNAAGGSETVDASGFGIVLGAGGRF